MSQFANEAGPVTKPFAVKFGGEVTPNIKKVTYKIDMKRVINRRLVMGIGDGVLEADGVPIYWAADLRVGLYQRP